MKNLFLTAFSFFVFTLNAQTSFFYVGSATDKVSAPISLCSLDLTNGKLSKVQSFEGTRSSSYLCISPQENFLYAVNGGTEVTSFKINQETKELRFINTQPVEGKGACHLSTTSDNKFLMVANYSSGNIVVLPIKSGGALKSVISNKQHTGHGPNKKRQEGPHAHYVTASLDDQYVFAVDLGIDKVMNYALDSTTGELSENPNQAFLVLAPEQVPGIWFSIKKGNAFVLNELSSTVSACKYDAKNGVLSLIDTYPMLPEEFDEFSKAAAIRIHPYGKFLYASNRGHDSMAVFKIKKNGKLKRIQIIQDGVEWPRDYNIDPSGKYMLVANRNKNEIRTFLIGADGKLSATENVLEIAQPTCVEFFLN